MEGQETVQQQEEQINTDSHIQNEIQQLDEGEEVEMTYEELLIYSARYGEIEDVQFCIDEKVELNTNTDQSQNTALRKSHFNAKDLMQTWLVLMDIRSLWTYCSNTEQIPTS